MLLQLADADVFRRPQTGQLGLYKDALERLNASIAFKSSDADSLETVRLTLLYADSTSHAFHRHV